jgi:hypothetical protein
LLFRAGHGGNEPADQHQPQAADVLPGKQLQQADRPDADAEDLPGACGGPAFSASFRP